MLSAEDFELKRFIAVLRTAR